MTLEEQKALAAWLRANPPRIDIPGRSVVDPKYVENGKVNYDRMNEEYSREEAIKARAAGNKKSQEWYTKNAMHLRAEQDRKKKKK